MQPAAVSGLPEWAQLFATALLAAGVGLAALWQKLKASAPPARAGETQVIAVDRAAMEQLCAGLERLDRSVQRLDQSVTDGTRRQCDCMQEHSDLLRDGLRRMGGKA